jgi:hypothetical protein
VIKFVDFFVGGAAGIYVEVAKCCEVGRMKET